MSWDLSKKKEFKAPRWILYPIYALFFLWIGSWFAAAFFMQWNYFLVGLVAWFFTLSLFKGIDQMKKNYEKGE